MNLPIKPSHAVVGGWVAFNTVLALVQIVFDPFQFSTGALPVALYLVAVGLVATFGVAVLLAVRAGRVGVQERQPRHAAAAGFAALGTAVAAAGFAFGWWVSLFGVYPLLLAAWLVRGERLRVDASPWPVTLDGAEPAGPPRFVHDGSSLGVATAVPVAHEAHGPPRPRPEPSRGARGAVLAVVGARAIAELLRGRRR